MGEWGGDAARGCAGRETGRVTVAEAIGTARYVTRPTAACDQCGARASSGKRVGTKCACGGGIGRRQREIRSSSRYYPSVHGGPLMLDRFFANVEPEPMSGCWLWIGARLPRGYGGLTMQRRKRYAHRVAWELRRGPIPPGLFVCHRCDTPACVNPAHLFLGTHTANMRDRVRKGRLASGENTPRGERHRQSKVTAADVVAIRAAHATGEDCASIARRYPICAVSVRAIVDRKTWR